MSMAEKSLISLENSQTIIENQQRVYDKGYNDGYSDGENSVLRLEKCMGSGTFTDLHTLGKSEIVLNLEKFTNLNYLSNVSVAGANTVVTHITINCPNLITSAFGMINWINDNTLKHVTLNIDFQKCTNLSGAFHNLKAIEIIDGYPLDFSSLTNTNVFNSNITNLKEIRFVENSLHLSLSFAPASRLSNASKQSIFDGLAVVETAQTLTLHKDVKILQSQVDSANAKGWTVAGGTVVSEEEYYAE